MAPSHLSIVPDIRSGASFRDGRNDVIARVSALAATTSFEMAANDLKGLAAARPFIPPGSTVSITWLPNDTHDQRVAAAVALRDAGFHALPHIAARRISGRDDLQELMGRLTTEAGVDRIFLIAGDVPEAIGPYQSSLELLARETPARWGIREIGFAGYPEGHPGIKSDVLDAELDTKIATAACADMETFVVTQFAFDARPIFAWIKAFRDRRNDSLVRVGLAGPANIRTLLRFARLCGVGSSYRALTSRGASIARLINEAGPDPVIRELVEMGTAAELGPVALHLFPFGGLDRAARWIAPVVDGRITLQPSSAGFRLGPES